MRRARIVIPVVFALFVFAALSLLLARGLSASGTERGKVVELLKAQARGDDQAVLAKLPACRAEPACVDATRATVARETAPGTVQVLTYAPSTRIALTERIGTARVAWRAGKARPVVQCVRVRREGALAGGKVELLAISAPIANDGSCQG